jgi:hypothetical protein
MSLVTLEPQYDFPRKNISENNANLLELLLLNQETVVLSHTIAEGFSHLYKTGHRVLSDVAAIELDDAQRARASSHGITASEVISAMVRLCFDVDEHNSAEMYYRILKAQH